MQYSWRAWHAAFALFCGVMWWTISGTCDAVEPLRLENKHVKVEIDPQSGGIATIRDKQQGITYQMGGIGFVVTTDNGSIKPVKPPTIHQSDEELVLQFAGTEPQSSLHYRLKPEDRFIEKWLVIEPGKTKPCFLKEVVLEDVTSSRSFSDIHFHDDQTIWHCPINLFLRGEKGGCFAGLEYPYWDHELRGKDGFRLGYKPNHQLAAGEVNTSEKYFLGVYRKEGIVRRSHGPYPGKRAATLLTWNGTGLSQHFKGNRVPAQAVAEETLDWGEVWAMQDFMRQVLPDQPLPEDGYWVWQNGWWANLFTPNTAIIEQLKAAGIHDIMTAHTWYGRGNHPNAEPYLSQMRIEPPGYPADKAIAGMPGPAGPAAGLHSPQQVLLDQFKPAEYTAEFIAPPAMEKFIEYGRKQGVHVSSFSLPGIWFNERPQWGAIDEAGKPCEYLFGRKVSCPACDEYMQHMLAVHEAVFSKYKPRWWGWDGRWMSYWEVPAYRPGPKGLGSDPCFAKNHGHVPGDNLYREWTNIQRFLAEIRKRHPRMCLEQYLGLKRGGPWALRYLNADDNYYETNGADMNRFQTWHNQNDRFRPVYKNYAAMFGSDARTFQFNVIATLSTTTYCQIGPGFHGLAHAVNREFLKQWRAWATTNHAYLKVKRDLFDCPGYTPVDGSAHILDNRGYVFLFPGGFDIKYRAPKPIRTSILINRWLGLNEDPAAVYQVTEIYPRKDVSLGRYRYGADFLYDMPKDSAVILSLTPAGKDAEPEALKLAQGDGDVIVVKAFAPVAKGTE